MSKFSENLIALRKERKLFQKDIATGIGCTLRAYQYYEADKQEPTLSKLTALADFYNVSLDYLVGRSDDPTRH